MPCTVVETCVVHVTFCDNAHVTGDPLRLPIIRVVDHQDTAMPVCGAVSCCAGTLSMTMSHTLCTSVIGGCARA